MLTFCMCCSFLNVIILRATQMLDDMAAATATVADGLGDAAAPTPAHLCGVLQREVCVAVEPAEAARAFLRDPDAFAAPAEKKRRHQHDLN